MLTALIFDFGEVLLRTGPEFLYRKIFDTEAEVEHFLTTVLPNSVRSSWNTGGSVEEEAEKLAQQNPEYAYALRTLFPRFIETVPYATDGMPEYIQELHASGMPLYGLTNWGADTFDMVPKAYPFLQLFDDILVSGKVGMKKPNPKIFEMAINRFQIDPATTLFTDDKEANVKAARGSGLQAVQFQSAPQLRRVITQLNES